MYTLLGGCEEWRADVARKYYENREQIFETRAFKDIGTVRNMMKWVVVCFVCFKMWVKIYYQSRGGRCAVPCTMYISKDNQFQVACMPGMMTHIIRGT